MGEITLIGFFCILGIFIGLIILYSIYAKVRETSYRQFEKEYCDAVKKAYKEACKIHNKLPKDYKETIK